MKRNHLHILLLILFISAWSCQKDPLSDSLIESAMPLRESATRSIPAANGNKWAVIISGGGTYMTNFVRYWNDCAFFYSTMKNVYGLSDNNIYVAMSDGTNSGIDRLNEYGFPESSPWDLDGDTISDIDFAATLHNVEGIFDALRENVKQGDEVIVFVTDHGEYSYGNASLVLWNNEMMSASDFKTNLNKISPQATKHIVMGQCHSGGFISELQGIKQLTISTACSVTQLSYSTSDFLYDEFLLHWTAAIAGEYPDGTNADGADTNYDGLISPREAFNFAQSNDSVSETPQFYEYKSLFGNIPFCYQYNYIEPYVIGPTDLNRGATYTFHIVNYNPDINPATLLPTSDFTLISSTDSTIVVSVNPTGGPSYGSIAFGLSSSNFNYLNSISSVGDVVIWQTGTFPDNMGAIEAYVVQPNVNVCLLSRFGLAANGFLWKTDASGWTILRKLLQEATFHYSNSWQNAPSQLDIAVDISNPFGNITTLTKTIYLTE